jgi:peptidoglycan/LPS O-acetylase OafA/YrhL
MKSLSNSEAEKSFLFTLRWLSSAIVMFGHTYSIIFHPYVDARGVGSIGGFLEYVAQFRHGAVVIFFVMSGYLVGGGVLDAAERFDFKRFFINRFSRIYIVLAPAILLTVALDLTAYLLAPDNKIYTNADLTGTLGIGGSIFERYDFQRVAATLLSLESVIGEPMGSNRALWSLGIEWFFYFLFPIALFALARIRAFGSYSAIIAALLVAFALVLAGRRGLAVYWIVWTAGAFCSQIRLSGPISRYLPWIGGGVGLFFFLGHPAMHLKIDDLFIGLGVALLFVNPKVLNWRLHRSMDKALADFSYSLYVVHMPVLVFMVFLFFQMGVIGLEGLVLSWTGLSLFLAASAVEIAIAFSFGRVFERRTDDLKRSLAARLAPRRAAYEHIGLS